MTERALRAGSTSPVGGPSGDNPATDDTGLSRRLAQLDPVVGNVDDTVDCQADRAIVGYENEDLLMTFPADTGVPVERHQRQQPGPVLDDDLALNRFRRTHVEVLDALHLRQRNGFEALAHGLEQENTLTVFARLFGRHLVGLGLNRFLRQARR